MDSLKINNNLFLSVYERFQGLSKPKKVFALASLVSGVALSVYFGRSLFSKAGEVTLAMPELSFAERVEPITPPPAAPPPAAPPPAAPPPAAPPPARDSGATAVGMAQTGTVVGCIVEVARMATANFAEGVGLASRYLAFPRLRGASPVLSRFLSVVPGVMGKSSFQRGVARAWVGGNKSSAPPSLRFPHTSGIQNWKGVR